MATIVIHKPDLKEPHFCSGCGAKLPFWGHDTTRGPGKRNKVCDSTDGSCPLAGKEVNWVRLEENGMPHDCPKGTKSRYRSPRWNTGNSSTATAVTEEEDDEPAFAPAPSFTPAAQPAVPVVSPAPVAYASGNGVALNGDAQTAAMMQLQQALNALVQPQQATVSSDQVRQIIAQDVPDMVADAVFAATAALRPVTTLHVRDSTGSINPVPGIANAALPDIIEGAAAGLNILMVGPMGTGKSFMAEQVGAALGLPVREISLTPQTAESRLFGYMDAQGRYVRTAFRDWWEHGGVFHFDELDNGHASIMAGINAAMAKCRNDGAELEFPDGRVKKAARTVGLASANTYGRGPDRQYLRQPLDAATLDRFEPVPVPYDRSIERAACLSTGLDSARVERTLAYVWHLREKADTAKLPLMLGMRRSHAVCTWQAIGRTPKRAAEISLRRDISDSDWRKVTEGAPVFM